MCGGTFDNLRNADNLRGLSPRVRGNLFHKGDGKRKKRSIPACAGEPTSIYSMVGAMRVYPRVCGGTCSLCIIALR